jgi:hypothetical protein
MALFPFLLFLARPFIAPRLELMAEILALRQQLAILNRTTKCPSLRFQDRQFWVTLARFCLDWRSAQLIVKPETAIKWHRQRVQWFSFIDVGSQRLADQTDQESTPKSVPLYAGFHKRIRCGARHRFNISLPLI